eukprot:TRINITY_DN20069_c0_g1_i1.p1 TRINITY_DN20069_c0_g1~~TRINITY_DN20069_c0_g1_i1.p1  ORF type:complete len:169 (-),score=20.83 TRINITY_DN20069_c0_g1_i1:3-509(-)
MQRLSRFEGLLRQRSLACSKTQVFPSAKLSRGTLKASSATSLLSKTRGALYSWGCNIDGQLGQSNVDEKSGPVKVEALEDADVKTISCGLYHSSVGGDLSDQKGRAWTFGSTYYAQLGQSILGFAEEIMIPTQISHFVDMEIKQILSGYWHGLALTTTGRTYAWGNGH